MPSLPAAEDEVDHAPLIRDEVGYRLAGFSRARRARGRRWAPSAREPAAVGLGGLVIQVRATITDQPAAAWSRRHRPPVERQRRDATHQKGWLVLSPRAKQVVVHTGHAVEEANPELVIDAILDVVKQAR